MDDEESVWQRIKPHAASIIIGVIVLPLIVLAVFISWFESDKVGFVVFLTQTLLEEKTVTVSSSAPDTVAYSTTGDGNVVIAKISHYYPPLLGPNCSVVVNGICVSKMSSGQPWQNWLDKAVACPSEYAFGTIFVIDGKAWICMDRGGAIVSQNTVVNGTFQKVIWLDLLTEHTSHPYGQEVPVKVYASGQNIPLTHGQSNGLTVTETYLVPKGQWQKIVIDILKYLDLVPQSLLEKMKVPSVNVSSPNNGGTGGNGGSQNSPGSCGDPNKPCLFPLQGGRNAYITGSLGCHTGGYGAGQDLLGMDWFKPDHSAGAIIYATHDGWVFAIGTDGIGNTYIKIRNNEWQTTYMHMETFLVTSGQHVKQGQSIARMGSIGNSDFPHLHYAIYSLQSGPVCPQDNMFQR
jgi:hypothetical protein